MAAGKPTDTSPKGVAESPQTEQTRKLQSVAASQKARAITDLNQGAPAPYKTSKGWLIYETAPIPIKRLLGSPLAMKGPYAVGQNGERRVSSGWGDPRSTGYNKNVNSSDQHHGLDFAAPFGEPVYACASGRVSLVGFQSKTGPVSVPGVHADDKLEQILNAKGEVVASTAADNIGFGGIYVWINHDNDFKGYRTEYYHLSNTHVTEGQRVEEGDLIANIGGTGGYYNWYHKGTHLHFQIALTAGSVRSLVRPTAMVPNVWPGHTDSTNSAMGTVLFMPSAGPLGAQAASSRAANVINGVNRAQQLEAKGVSEIKQDHSDHANATAGTIGVEVTANDAANAAFNGQAPKVVAPMTFDFDKGVWLQNNVEDGVT